MPLGNSSLQCSSVKPHMPYSNGVKTSAQGMASVYVYTCQIAETPK
jgi:hypothetical protein